jgi:hypothetical protein
MITFTTKCGRAKRHRLEINAADGSMHMLDHDEAMVRSFAAFGAKKPKCLEIIELWEDNPIYALTDRRLFGRKKVLTIVADWLDHVLPYFATVMPDDEHVAKAIVGIRRGLHGTYMTGLGNKVRRVSVKLVHMKETFSPRGPIGSTPFQAARVVAAVIAGTKMASQKGPGPQRRPGATYQRIGTTYGLVAADEAAAATVLPVKRVQRKKGQRRSGPGRFKQEQRIPEGEREWQIRRAIEILSEP